jgi:hypothetical protein
MKGSFKFHVSSFTLAEVFRTRRGPGERADSRCQVSGVRGDRVSGALPSDFCPPLPALRSGLSALRTSEP